jgi:hypothetical protein
MSPAYYGPFQANIFDGKSDGKNLSSILLRKFTVRSISRRRENLQIKAYSQLRIAGLGESLRYVAGLLSCRDLTSCKPGRRRAPLVAAGFAARRHQPAIR